MAFTYIKLDIPEGEEYLNYNLDNLMDDINEQIENNLPLTITNDGINTVSHPKGTITYRKTIIDASGKEKQITGECVNGYIFNGYECIPSVNEVEYKKTIRKNKS